MHRELRERVGSNTELERRAIREQAKRRLRGSTYGAKESSPWDYDDETHRFARRFVWGTFAVLVIGFIVFVLVAAATVDFVPAVAAALAVVLVIAGVAWLRRRRS